MAAPILHVVLCSSKQEALVQLEVLRASCELVTGPECYSEAYWENHLDNPPTACDALEGGGKELWVVFGRDV